MAKYYGSLVGTPVQGLQTSGVGFVSDRYKDGKDQILVRDVYTMAGNVATDTISLALLKSTAYIDQGNSFMWWGALGAGVTLSVGDATHPTALANAVAAATLGSGPLSPAFIGAWMAYPLWQRLGYAGDPGGNIELLATIGGAAPANGMTLAWQIFGRNT
jgi:hypothetical protein